ncbi:MAG: hypothetical protein ACK5LR_06060 [Mangrovibacterium sp.]
MCNYSEIKENGNGRVVFVGLKNAQKRIAFTRKCMEKMKKPHKIIWSFKKDIKFALAIE